MIRTLLGLLMLTLVPFDALPTYFEGDSRILKKTEDPDILLAKLKPTVFSLADAGVVEVPGIDKVRTELNAYLCQLLHDNGVQTSTLTTEGDIITMRKERVPPIEVVVKAAHIGTPKHIYRGMSNYQTRLGRPISDGKRHTPYVRFDWRNPLPEEDACMPDALADRFIDTEVAKRTALKAFGVLQNTLSRHGLELLDICFFMNESGDTICAEISTDNCRIAYSGHDSDLKALFASRKKEDALARGKAVLSLLRGPPIPRRRVVLSGGFCTGKTTVIGKLQEELGIPKLIDEVTRPMRPGDRQGFPYDFISREDFEAKAREGYYFEWVEFNGNYYGVPRHKILDQDSWVLDITSSSWQHYWGQVPGIVGIYFEAPSHDELIKRARERGDSEEHIESRLELLAQEDWSGYDYIIPATTSLEEKIEMVKQVILSEI